MPIAFTPSPNSSASSVAWIASVGASAGLGAALARRFAYEGFIVALTGHTPEQVGAVATEVEAAGGRAHAFAGDAMDRPKQARTTVRSTKVIQ